MIALTSPQLNSIDEVIHGEALAVLRTLPDNSVDAIVCDPPAGISFMGKDWDDPDYFPLRDRGPRLTGSGNPTESRGFARGITLDSSKKARDTFISWLSEVMAEALRVLKPGGHAFVWALPRTSHWTGIALEDAGFEVRDVVTHLFGSGFPKSHDISAAIDKMQGAEREVVGKTNRCIGPSQGKGYKDTSTFKETNWEDSNLLTAPATPEAAQWDGWGTALKPASENWYLVRKPLSEKSIAANVLKWGTGAINIDACRITSTGNDINARKHKTRQGSTVAKDDIYAGGWVGTGNTWDGISGRWPANLLLSHSVWCVPNGVKKVRANGVNTAIPSDRKNGAMLQNMKIHGSVNYNDSEGMEQVEDWLCTEDCPVRLLDEQSGMRKSGGGVKSKAGHSIGLLRGEEAYHFRYDGPECEPSEGGASRYFQRFYYVSKASRSERNKGCEGLPALETRIVNNQNCKVCTECGKHLPNSYTTCSCGGSLAITEVVNPPKMNSHPTVKPVNLLRYLVRMITPPGGIVLDCFAGSGSTCVAAIHEGMHFIGIEMNDTQDEPYVTIARARIEQAFREVQP